MGSGHSGARETDDRDRTRETVPRPRLTTAQHAAYRRVSPAFSAVTTEGKINFPEFATYNTELVGLSTRLTATRSCGQPAGEGR
jgi:hypothetical protein